MLQKILAWCVHCYTALGLAIAALSTTLIVIGGEENLRNSLMLLFIAMAIDASDGYFARLARVKEVVPTIDGRRLDDIIDFHTYTSIPLLFIWRSDLFPGDIAWILILPLMASAYGFSQTNAKTEDGCFLGFPSYWNVIAFYLFFLKPEVWFSFVIIVVFSVLTFIPVKYLYPSMPGPLSKLSVLIGVIWSLIVLSIIVGIVDEFFWTMITLAFPVYYMVASWVIALKDYSSYSGK
jgi:phosphatidylcholine synthase